MLGDLGRIEGKDGVAWVPPGGKAHVIQLDLIHPQLGCLRGQVEEVLLHLRQGGIDPIGNASFTPQAALLRARYQVGAVGGQTHVVETGQPRNHVQPPLMEFVHQYGGSVDGGQ